MDDSQEDNTCATLVELLSVSCATGLYLVVPFLGPLQPQMTGVHGSGYTTFLLQGVQSVQVVQHLGAREHSCGIFYLPLKQGKSRNWDRQIHLRRFGGPALG